MPVQENYRPAIGHLLQAWRIAHLAACAEVYRNWTFEDQRLGLPQFAVPGTRDALNEWVHSAQDRFTRSVDGLD